MEDSNRKESGASKILTSEHLQKLEDLQRRRQEIQKAQDERSKKKRSKKKGKKGGPENPESMSGAQASTPAQDAPDSVPTKGFGQRWRLEVGENHSFTPSKELGVIPANENPEESLQVERRSKNTTAPGSSHDGTVTKEAVALRDGGGRDGGSATLARRKRQKLHWGLDSKERWERKSNM